MIGRYICNKRFWRQYNQHTHVYSEVNIELSDIVNRNKGGEKGCVSNDDIDKAISEIEKFDFRDKSIENKKDDKKEFSGDDKSSKEKHNKILWTFLIIGVIAIILIYANFNKDSKNLN